MRLAVLLYEGMFRDKESERDKEEGISRRRTETPKRRQKGTIQNYTIGYSQKKEGNACINTYAVNEFN